MHLQFLCVRKKLLECSQRARGVATFHRIVTRRLSAIKEVNPVRGVWGEGA